MTNYLTRPGGREISNQLPLQVDDVTQSSDRIAVAAETITFDCAVAASGRGAVALDKAPILNLAGDRIGRYWDNPGNQVYITQDTDLIGTLTETATSATAVITDTSDNLELMFETPTAASARYILKATDSGGNTLYGWIKLVAASTDVYTFDIYNTAAMATQSWVGTLGDFDNSDISKIEIYSNESSFVWGTGTVLTEEVAYDEEKDEQTFINELAAGQFGINYRSSKVLYRKATTETSDTCTYNTMATASVSISGSGTSTNATHDSAVLSIGPQIMLEAINFDGTAAPNVVGAEGDAVRPVGTLSGIQMVHVTNSDGSDFGQIKGYDAAADANKSYEVSPLSSRYVQESLVDTTNEAAATTYYPSSTGAVMDGHSDLSLSGKFIDADGTVTMTVEMSNDEDSANADWIQVYGYDDKNNTTTNSWTVTNGTLTFANSFTRANYKRYRVAVVYSGATNTSIIKSRKKAL